MWTAASLRASFCFLDQVGGFFGAGFFLGGFCFDGGIRLVDTTFGLTAVFLCFAAFFVDAFDLTAVFVVVAAFDLVFDILKSDRNRSSRRL